MVLAHLGESELKLADETIELILDKVMVVFETQKHIFISKKWPF